MNNRDTIKRIFDSKLDDHEYESIVKSREVEIEMKREWDQCDAQTNYFNSKGVWRSIQKDMKKGKRKYNLAQIVSLVASVAALISVGIFVGVSYDGDWGGVNQCVAMSGRSDINQVTLPDGTIVTMGPNTTLTYPEKFAGPERRVKVEGDAFFEVAHDKSKPFYADGSQISVKALGTEFELYSVGDLNEATLLSGSVAVEIESIDEVRLLEPNDKLDFYSFNNTLEISSIDADQYLSWKDGRGLSFKDESLTTIVARLEKWYNVNIDIPTGIDEVSEKHKYSFDTLDKPLSFIMYLISRSADLELLTLDDGYELYKKD